MNKRELLENMSIDELRDVIHAKLQKEAIDKCSTKIEGLPFNIKEVNKLVAEGNGNLFVVRVDDGCEGWEALVEVDDSVTDSDIDIDLEDLVKDYIINFIIKNDYYKPGDISEISVEEICRYGRPIFKIK